MVNFVLHLLPGMAGALAGWVIILALGAGLVWRAPQALRLRPRTLAGFLVTVLALFWVALASRQTLGIPDAYTHLGLTATLRAGAYPPTFPWLPGVTAPYHHSIATLVALLTPPFGPDLAFVTELLGAYVWTSLVLMVAAILLRHGGRVGPLAVAPLLLTPGAWTLAWLVDAPVILHIPVPAGVPAAGLRASLADIYWPSVQPWAVETDATPPNVWKPLFVLAYALAVVALERVSASRSRAWPAALTLGALIGFLGLVDEPVALMTLALLVLLEAWHLLHASRERSIGWGHDRTRGRGTNAGHAAAGCRPAGSLRISWLVRKHPAFP